MPRPSLRQVARLTLALLAASLTASSALPALAQTASLTNSAGNATSVLGATAVRGLEVSVDMDGASPSGAQLWVEWGPSGSYTDRHRISTTGLTSTGARTFSGAIDGLGYGTRFQYRFFLTLAGDTTRSDARAIYSYRNPRPGDLTASQDRTEGVVLAWTDRARVEQGYRITRDGQAVHTTAPDAQAWTDTGALAGVTHTYCVVTLGDDDLDAEDAVCLPGRRVSDSGVAGFVRDAGGFGVGGVEVCALPQDAGALSLEGGFLRSQASYDLDGKSFTVEFWVKDSGNGGAEAYVALGAEPDAFADGFSVALDGNTPRGFTIFSGVNTANIENFVSAPVGVWEHYAVAYDRSTRQLRAYRNGAAIFLRDDLLAFGVGDRSSFSGPLWIGRTAGGRLAAQALMQEVRLWDRALSAGEIGDRYRLPSVAGAGLIGRWPLVGGDLSDAVASGDLVASGAVGTAADAPLSSTCATTSADGSYRIDAVPYGAGGPIAVAPSATGGATFAPASQTVVLDGPGQTAQANFVRGGAGADLPTLTLAPQPADLGFPRDTVTVGATLEVGASDASAIQSARLEYGVGGAFDRSVSLPLPSLASGGTASLAARMEGLQPGATYRYRFAVGYLGGTVRSGEGTVRVLRTSFSASDSLFEGRTRLRWEVYQAGQGEVTLRRDGVVLAALAGGQRSYDDHDGALGTAYTYCLAFLDYASGQTETLCDEGSRRLFPATGFAASDGDFAGRVRLKWTATPSDLRAGFRVLRDGAEIATLGADARSYDDAAVPSSPGAHTYCLAAFDASGAESRAVCDPGAPSVLLPPTDVAASDYAFTDRIAVTWQPSAEAASGYRITRARTLDVGDATLTGLDFDGAGDYATLAFEDPPWGVSSSFTIQMWIKTTDADGVLFDWGTREGGNASLGGRVGLMISGGVLRLEAHGNPGLVGTTRVDTGEWTHIALTVARDPRGGNHLDRPVAFYIDGALEASGVTRGAYALSTSRFQAILGKPDPDAALSQYTTVLGEPYAGRIADVRFWREARAAAAVGADYATTVLTGAEPNLVGAWPMAEGSGAAFTDVSARAQAGALFGAAWAAREAHPLTRRGGGAATVVATLGAEARHYEEPASAGQPFVYCVAALSGALTSRDVCDGGVAGFLPAPTAFSASDDAREDGVALAWAYDDRTARPDSFRVYRDGARLAALASDARALLDTSAAPGQTHAYCLTAATIGAESAQTCADGRRAGTLAPASFAATRGDHEDRIALTWSAPVASTGFLRLTRGGSIVQSFTPTETSYDDYDAPPGQAVAYCLEAVTQSGLTSTETCAEGRRDIAPPESLTASFDNEASDGLPVSERVVQLAWTDASEVETSYRVRRAVAGENVAGPCAGVTYGDLATLPAGAQAYADTTAVPGVRYCYAVRAEDAAGESAAAEARGRRILESPTNLAATDRAYEDRVDLSWTDASRAETGYRVEREQTGRRSTRTLVAALPRGSARLSDALGDAPSVAETLENRPGGNALSLTGPSAAGLTMPAIDNTPGYRALDQEGHGEPFTVDVWLKTTEASAGIITSGGRFSGVGRGEGLLFALGLEDGRVRFDSDGAILRSEAAIHSGAWTHVALVYDGAVQRLYVNGVIQQSIAAPLRPDDRGVLTISARYANVDDYRGQMDELRIWRRAFSAVGVEGLMRMPSSGTEDALVRYLPFENDGFATSGFEILGEEPGRAQPVASTTAQQIGRAEVTGPWASLAPPPLPHGLAFDGGGFMQTPEALDLRGGFTIEFWARNTGGSAQGYVIGQGVPSPNQGLHVGFRGAGIFTLAFYAQDINTARAYADIGAWHHWAVTYDPSSGEKLVYRDGRLEPTVQAGDNDNPFYEGTGPLLIGRGATGDPFQGGLDELRVWDRPRTEAEIAADFDQTLDGDESGLVLYLPLDEGDGAEARDALGGPTLAVPSGLAWIDGGAPSIGAAAGQAGLDFTYYVSATDARGASEASVATGSSLLRAPQDVGATTEYTDRVLVAWTDASGYESGYRVTRDGEVLATYGPGASGFTDRAASGEHVYCVEAVSGAGRSGEVCATGRLKDAPSFTATAIAPPSGVQASDGQQTNVALTWADAEGEAGYVVFRDGERLAELEPDATTFADDGALPGTLHEYCVAIREAGNDQPTRTCDGGWRQPNGTITGRVVSQEGDAVPGVGVCLDPNPDRALRFDGVGGYAEAPDSDTYDFAAGESFTVSLSAQFEAGQRGSLVEKWSGGGGYPFVIRADAAGHVRCARYDGSANPSVGTNSVGLVVGDGAWHHIACAFDAGAAPSPALRLYVDGQEVASTFVTALGETRNSSPLFLGRRGGSDSEWFAGSLDDVRLYDRALTPARIAALAARAIPLDAAAEAERGLVAAFPLDQSAGLSPNVVPGAREHLRLVGGVLPAGAPTTTCSATDLEGTYALRGVPYGAEAAYRVVPTDTARVFEPRARTVALSLESPVQNEVEFADVSSYALAGLVAFNGPYADAVQSGAANLTGGGFTCPAPGVEILVDGDVRTTTETDGSFSTSLLRGTYAVQPRAGSGADAHPFSPASQSVTLLAPRFDVDFADRQRFTLSGFVAGGSCGIDIGTVTLRITSPNGCYDQRVTVATGGITAGQADNYALALPPQIYTVEVVDVEETATSGVARADVLAFFEAAGPQTVDLSAGDARLDLLYRADVRLLVAGLGGAPSFTRDVGGEAVTFGFDAAALSCQSSLTGALRLQQSQTYHLGFTLVEDYGEVDGAALTCPVPGVTLRLDDGIGDRAAPVEVTTDDDGRATYALAAGRPNFARGLEVDGQDRSYQKSLTATADLGGSAVQRTLWAIVEGYLERPSTFVSAVTERFPTLILHDPPGSDSYAYLEEGTRSCTRISHTKLFGDGAGPSVDANVGFKINAGGGLGFISLVENGGGLSFQSRTIFGEELDELDPDAGGAWEVCTEVTERWQTSDDPTWVGEDLVAGTALNLVFALSDNLAVETGGGQCRPYTFERPAVDLDQAEPFATAYVYGTGHIGGTLIPELRRLRCAEAVDLSGGPDDAAMRACLDPSSDAAQTYDVPFPSDPTGARLSFNEAIGGWQSHLDLVAANKTAATRDTSTNRSFSAGIAYEFGDAYERTDWTKLESKRVYSATEGATGGLATITGYENRLQIAFEQNVETLREEEQATTGTKQQGYILSDGDTGDYFSLNIGRDPRYGTFAFRTISGRSSNPAEAFTQPRDSVVLTVDGGANAVAYVDEPDGTAVFTLGLSNLSPSGERRAVVLDVVKSSNPGSAVVGITGDPIGQEEFLIEPGETVDLELAVEPGPRRYAYEDIELVAYPPGEREIWEADPRLPFRFADTVRVSVYFPAPCSDVALEAPRHDTHFNGFALSPGSPNLNLRAGGFEVAPLYAPILQEVGFRYRRAGTDELFREVPGGTRYVDLTQARGQSASADADSLAADSERVDLNWDVYATGLTDGAYEVAAFTECESAGVQSEPITITLDREAPALFGTPSPEDQALALGDDIAATFSEAIACGSVRDTGGDANGQNVWLFAVETDAATGEVAPTDTVAVRAQCAGSTLVLTPRAADKDSVWASLEGRRMRVELRGGLTGGAEPQPRGLTDLAGNGLEELPSGQPVHWDFTVSRSAFQWSPGTLGEVLALGESRRVEATLVNGRASGLDFSLADVPDWLSADITSGYLAPGGSQRIAFTLPDTLGVGARTALVRAEGADGSQDSGGGALGTTLTLRAEVRCLPPDWPAPPALAHFMSVVARLELDSGTGFAASMDAQDRVAVFLGDQLRGVAAPSMASGAWLAEIAVQHGERTGGVLSFEVWDQSECRLYPNAAYLDAGGAPGLLRFDAGASEAQRGTTSAPVTLQASDALDGQQTVALAAGWSFFSVNRALAGDPPPLSNAGGTGALDGLTPAPGDLIKSQTQFAVYDAAFGWQGSLTALAPGEAYKTRFAAPQTLVAHGEPLPSATDLAIRRGWTWLAYLPTTPLAPDAALGDATDTYTPSTGDVLKDRFGFSTYVEGIGWVGEVRQMEPGRGYLLRSAQPGTLRYAAPATSESLALATPPRYATRAASHGNAFVAERDAEARERSPVPDKRGEASASEPAPSLLAARVDGRAFEASMSVVARVLDADGAPLPEGTRVIAAIGEPASESVGVRGSGTVREVPASGERPADALVFLTVHGAPSADMREPAPIRFAYEGSDGALVWAEATLAFRPDAVEGSVLEPVVLSAPREAAVAEEELPRTVTLGKAWPNPASRDAHLRYGLPEAAPVRIEVYDALGRRVLLAEATDAARAGWHERTLDVRSLAAGLYFVRLRAGDVQRSEPLVVVR